MSGRSAPVTKKGNREVDAISHLHLRIGWWSLLLFLTLGLTLETLHGFKVGLYLDVANSTRRLMWTLAHAHGALFSVLHLVFVASLQLLPDWRGSSLRLASICLIGALVLTPLGFFLGGVSVRGGDPGIGVILVPPGAILLFFAVLLTARACGNREP